MKKTAILSVIVISVLLAGCSGGDDTNAGAPPTKGPTTAGGGEAGAMKGGKGGAKGLSPNDLTPPPNGGTANFGSKSGGK
ncbi:MAG TPA: hypothetical protein VHE55_12720 [Fimbriimonadaceae bacterium]|nr:hypothetical protein [Fimbriimonadaceae bacterium]